MRSLKVNSGMVPPSKLLALLVTLPAFVAVAYALGMLPLDQSLKPARSQCIINGLSPGGQMRILAFD